MILNLPLSEAGGKGLFTKELDLALLEGNIEMAVHSAKDLPTILAAGIEIAGYLPRADVRDAWISPHAPHPLKLPPGSLVGTASLRRGAMVRRLRPDLRIALLRGNVETRLAKVAKGEVAATLLALAGLKRLGLEAAATAVLDVREFVPAAGQGAIAITIRAGDRPLGFPGAGSRCGDGHSPRGGARLSKSSRWLLQDADWRICVPRSGQRRVSRHRAETRWFAVFRDGGVRAIGRGGIARRNGRARTRGPNSRPVFSIVKAKRLALILTHRFFVSSGFAKFSPKELAMCTVIPYTWKA